MRNAEGLGERLQDGDQRQDQRFAGMVHMLLVLHDRRAQARIPLVFGADEVQCIASDRFDDLLEKRNRFARAQRLSSHAVDNAALEVIECTVCEKEMKRDDSLANQFGNQVDEWINGDAVSMTYQQAPANRVSALSDKLFLADCTY